MSQNRRRRRTSRSRPPIFSPITSEIGDPAVVKEYRIYSQYSTSGLVLEGTTVSTSIDVVSPVAIEGLVFCVSAVTVENVESHLTCGSSD